MGLGRDRIAPNATNHCSFRYRWGWSCRIFGYFDSIVRISTRCGPPEHEAVMPQIELKPHQYDRQDPKTGKMVRDYSPKFLAGMMLVALVILGYIFWHREELTSGTLFGVTAMFAFIAGGFFANLLKDRY